MIPIAALSGGLKARLVFAEVMFHGPAVLLMDEPTNHLDFESIEALALALGAFGGAAVVVSHNTSFLCTCCDELWVVREDGQVEVTKTAPSKGGVTFEEAFKRCVCGRWSISHDPQDIKERGNIKTWGQLVCFKPTNSCILSYREEVAGAGGMGGERASHSGHGRHGVRLNKGRQVAAAGATAAF
eukprot:354232-Pyramimonas_sp.AAC.1